MQSRITGRINLREIEKIDCNDSSKLAGLTICPNHARRENK
jgi:hypothetical protein